MGLVVHLHELADGGVRVPLRGRKRAVAEQFLNGTEVRTVSKQVGGKGVTQRVRVHVPVNVQDRKSTRLNSSHIQKSRMPSSA